MGRFIGKKAKLVEIKVPTGKKIKGIVSEIKTSDLYPNSLNIKIECPEHTSWSEDGQRQFIKIAYFSFPMDWSPKNKAGKLYQALTGKLPTGDVDWDELLLNREVGVIFSDELDPGTGEFKGQRVMWIGNMDGSGPKAPEKKTRLSSGSAKKEEESALNEEVPF